MSRCYCGGVIFNGHHCENGHLQDRSGQAGTLEDVIGIERGQQGRTGNQATGAANSPRKAEPKGRGRPRPRPPSADYWSDDPGETD